MLKTCLLLLFLLMIAAPVFSQKSSLIDFADPANPSALNPVLLWDKGESSDSGYSVTEISGKLLLMPAANTLTGPSVCQPASGDFTAQVHLKIAPDYDRQGAGIFVREPGTYDHYIGAGRLFNADLHSIGAWGIGTDNIALRNTFVAFIAGDVDLRIERQNERYTIAFKGGARHVWKTMHSAITFPLPDNVEICLNAWSGTAGESTRVVFSDFAVTTGG